METTNLSQNTAGLAAIFVVTDLLASVSFYRDALGFTVEDTYGDPPTFAIANCGPGAIMLSRSLSDPPTDGIARNTDRVRGLWDAYVWVRNLDSLMADLRSRGTPFSDPEETDYNCREITVTDPDGYIICFGYCP